MAVLTHSQQAAARTTVDVESLNLKLTMAGAQHFQLEQPQLFVKLKQPVLVAFNFAKLGPQLVQKQRLDALEDVFLAGVVRTQVAPRLVVHDALEQAAEDGRADSRPVERGI